MAYVKTETNNGYAYFENSSGDYKAISDPNTLKQLGNGGLPANEVSQDIISPQKPVQRYTQPTDSSTGSAVPTISEEANPLEDFDRTALTADETQAIKDKWGKYMQQNLDAIDVSANKMVNSQNKNAEQLKGSSRAFLAGSGH